MAVPTPVRKRHEPPVLPDTLNSGSLRPENKKAKTSGENEKDAAQPVRTGAKYVRGCRGCHGWEANAPHRDDPSTGPVV